MKFNSSENEAIICSIRENIDNGNLESTDIPYSLELIKRLDKELNEEDLNIIDFCTRESYYKFSKSQFSNEYTETLDEVRYKLFKSNN